ncbi:helix-turn-helix transcriptional regulator [Dyella sp.]|jgi:hypothetical protein|uniref:helix-turn-helix domain-containing protein n=1 Tax=Dyella sp. TaxID=1869338 RepID=UPI002D7956F5|nr:helix-turn-helix transcriptional regulator [Dyella sp.]HET6434050.1 helix-turn-helix transcriptional regulator [Dyella sp.]
MTAPQQGSRPLATAHDSDMAAVPRSAAASASFAERIRLLIQRVGSATEIARMCGFSEGVVRSWRDGNSDPSRARCVTLARTLGISLVWLVAGEGTIQPEAGTGSAEEAVISETSGFPRDRGIGTAVTSTHDALVHGAPSADAPRLAAARELLRSNLQLSGIAVGAAEYQRLLDALYDIVGPGGTQVDAMALLAFHRQLAERAGDRTRLA